MPTAVCVMYQCTWCMLSPLFPLEDSDYRQLQSFESFVNIPTFPDNLLRQCFDIPIIDDEVSEVVETFQFQLIRTTFTASNVVVRRNTTTIVIIDDDGMFIQAKLYLCDCMFLQTKLCNTILLKADPCVY